ncbi:MAG: HAMP domain-containing histidine kinase [Clostridiales bacterium]|nr:HAMP domain-containing histidine kinase [Clostridiales bacterium]
MNELYATIAVAVIFALSTVLLSILLFAVKKGVKEINEQLPTLIKGDTNAQLLISSLDSEVKNLACTLNSELKVLREKELTYVNGDKELKSAITNVAHDIRTPLTAICGYLDMIKEESDLSKKEKYLDIMRERARALRTLSEELFKYSVASDNQKVAQMEKVNVNALLQETMFSFYTRFNEKGIMPNINICEDAVTRITDKNALTRIFSNIIDNAIKYSDGDFSVKMNGDGAISFSNAASNLDNVNVQKLFDRFYTVENCNYSTGLGLSIAKLLTKQIGGEISADLKDKVLTITLTI